MEYQVVLFLSTYLLKMSFRSKRIMAQTLGVPYRSLLCVFNYKAPLEILAARIRERNRKKSKEPNVLSPFRAEDILLSFQSKFFPGKSKSEPFLQEEKVLFLAPSSEHLLVRSFILSVKYTEQK